VGDGSLVVEIEVDTREEVEGWQEEVEHNRGPVATDYKLHTDKKTWEEAEAACQTAGGHLASVLPASLTGRTTTTTTTTTTTGGHLEQEVLAGGAGGRSWWEEVVWQGDIWVGGKLGQDGVWRWTDGTLVGEVEWGGGGSSPLCFDLFVCL
jgi:hypothetical protein